MQGTLTGAQEQNTILADIFAELLTASDRKLNLILNNFKYGLCESGIEEQECLESAKILQNLTQILNYCKTNELIKETVVFQANSDLIAGLNILYEFYKDYKLSNLIELPIDIELTQDILDQLDLIIDNFASIDVRVRVNLTLTKAHINHDLENFEQMTTFNWVRQNHGLIKMVLDNTTVEYWRDIELWLKLIKYDNVTYIESCEPLSEASINYFVEFVRHVFSNKSGEELYKLLYFSEHYSILRVEANSKLNCPVQECLNIYVPTLAILGCPGLNNKLYTLGFINENNEVTANNSEFAITVAGDLISVMPSCLNCNFTTICSHGCMKESYLANNNILVPDKTFCEKQQEKFIAISEAYKKSKLFEYIATVNK